MLGGWPRGVIPQEKDAIAAHWLSGAVSYLSWAYMENLMTNAAVGMPCPVCKVPLTMSERQGVEIDYCPQCRGVWLDRGELDKIIERAAQDAPSAQAAPQRSPTPYPAQQQKPYYGDDDRHRGSDDRYPKRRKSFLEELFD